MNIEILTKVKGETLFLCSEERNRKTKKYGEKCLIPACTVMYKKMSKKHVSIFIIQQIQTLGISNIQDTSF